MKETKYIPGDLVMFKNPFEPSDTCVGIVKFLGNISDIILLCPYTNLNLEYFIKVENIQGIPITSEILEKNGWNTQNGWFYYQDVRKGFISCIDIDFQHKSGSGKLLVKLNNDNLLEIEYVHQLQHLLFGLGLNYEMKV